MAPARLLMLHGVLTHAGDPSSPTGDDPLKLWPGVHAIDVLGLTATGEPLIWSGPMVDGGPEDAWLLLPGDVRAGTCTLDTLPTLEAQLRATDVLVLWRHELRLDNAVGVTTGAVVFPRRPSSVATTSR
jgi:hypothetical protein